MRRKTHASEIIVHQALCDVNIGPCSQLTGSAVAVASKHFDALVRLFIRPYCRSQRVKLQAS
jgi:hypothetical protein